jgi:hypothetical protein
MDSPNPTSTPFCIDMKSALIDAIQRSIDAGGDKSLGEIYDKPLYEGFPPDYAEPPVITYGFTESGARGILTIIVWGGDFRKMHTRINSVLNKADLPRFRVKYMTSGPVQWDDRLRTFYQRASYLIKTLPAPEKSP